MQKTPIVVIAVKWENAVAVVRSLTWVTNPQEALPWTIRGDFWLTINANIIHASDTPENAEIELNRFFKKDEIFEYTKISDEVL
jgi:nucleoside-diphosphate kinase